MDIVSPWDRIYEVLAKAGIDNPELCDDLYAVFNEIEKTKSDSKISKELAEIQKLADIRLNSSIFETFDRMKNINELIIYKLQALNHESSND